MLRRCVRCGELRGRMALDDGERICRSCVAYAAKRVTWYGAASALPAGLQLSVRSATEAAPVAVGIAPRTHRRRAA